MAEAFFYMQYFRQFGSGLREEDLGRFKDAPQWNGKIFKNLERTEMNMSLMQMPGLLGEFLSNRSSREPKEPLPVQPLDIRAFLAADAAYVWYGHSVVLLRLAGKTILIDPMLGPDAAPIAPFSSRRFSQNTLELIDRFPEIEVCLLSHDHYDHLDLASIERLKPKVKQWKVALGVARHLESWGIAGTDMEELDWWQETKVGELEIHFTPTRHFSGRGLNDRFKSLWGGWVLKSAGKSYWFSGDSGYGKHLKAVGDKLGPFDVAFMECGQYNERWANIHMFPEESVKAAKEARVQQAVPVHWGGFSLALHPWQEPVNRFVAEAEKQQQSIALPRLGQLVKLGEQPQERWWE